MTKEDLWWMPLDEYLEVTDPELLDNLEFLDCFPACRNETNAFNQYEKDTKRCIAEQTEKAYHEHELDMQKSDDYICSMMDPEYKYNQEYFQWHHLMPIK